MIIFSRKDVLKVMKGRALADSRVVGMLDRKLHNLHSLNVGNNTTFLTRKKREAELFTIVIICLI